MQPFPLPMDVDSGFRSLLPPDVPRKPAEEPLRILPHLIPSYSGSTGTVATHYSPVKACRKATRSAFSWSVRLSGLISLER